MVGKYQRKSDRQSWSENAMQRAIDAVNSGQAGWLKASKIYGVPQATLRRRVQNKNVTVHGNKKGLGRYQTTFDPDLEREIVEHIKLLESRLFGLTATDVRKLAYDLAEKNGLEHRFNKTKKIAGWDWLAGFRQRHPDIALRKPEPTSKARAMAFNKSQVAKFFRTYQATLEKHNIQPTRIYNMDESALSTVQKPPKVFAQTGKKQVGALTSAERGIHVTMVCCMSTTGHFVPPALIFPRKRWKVELIDGAPLGTLGMVQEHGWMTGSLFLDWLKHFKKFTSPTLTDKVLLIVDGHSSHKGIEVLTFAKDNGIVVLSLPPHCTHRLQPLDVAFYGPMKTHYDQEISLWLKAHPDRVLSQFQISRLFAAAYSKTAQTAIAESGFRNTGIWPVNPNIFPDYLFSPSETTNITQDAINTGQDEDNNNTNDIADAIINNNRNVDIDVEVAGQQTPEKLPREKSNSQEETQLASSLVPQILQKKVIFSVKDISPIPQAVATTSRKRKATASEELTSTPNMEEIKAKQLEKNEKEKVKDLRRRAKAATKMLVLPEISQKLETSRGLRRTARQSIKIVSQTKFEDDSNPEEDPFADDDGEEDVGCLYCNSLFSESRSKEKWIKCIKCNQWAHCECADVTPKKKKFICEVCLE